jgi:hypothetical protein
MSRAKLTALARPPQPRTKPLPHRELGRKIESLGEKSGPRFRSGSGFRKYETVISDAGKVNNLIAKGGNSFSPDNYRDALKPGLKEEKGGYDELFSTSTVEKFLTGFFNERSTPLTADEQKLFNNVINQISDARIPTKYSGYSIKRGGETRRMQHPTGRRQGFFADDGDRDALSAHSYADRTRRQKVTEAMEAAQGADEEVVDVLKAGLRAGIRDTLNNFTAPVTADNVFRFSRRSGTNRFGEENLDQVRARDLMKEMYVWAGGDLPDPDPAETAQQALSRAWEGPSDARLAGNASPDDRRLSPLRVRRARAVDAPGMGAADAPGMTTWAGIFGDIVQSITDALALLAG